MSYLNISDLSFSLFISFFGDNIMFTFKHTLIH